MTERAVDMDKSWMGSPMLLVTSTIDAKRTGNLAEKMTAIEMTLASLIMSTEELQRLRALGFSVFQTDLDQMGTNEISDGVWDWQVTDTHLQACTAAGGKWSVAAHFHVPPPWFSEAHEFVPMRCVEHDAIFPGWSIWHPGAVEFKERGYRALSRQYGDQIHALWVGVHGDYGENEYPTGYRAYHAAEAEEWRERFGDAHDHSGWWCQDEFARADFRKRMIDKYGALTNLNSAWETNFNRETDIAYPTSTQQKRYWLDFVRWYFDSMTRFSVATAKVAQTHLPDTRLFWLLGGPCEASQMGQDQSGLAKAASETGIEIRSSHGYFLPFPGNYATMFKRIGSACKFYGVPFWSEPPYSVDAGGAVGRIFEAVSCGAVAYYDWAWNPLEPSVQRTYEKFGRYLTQEKPVVDVALFYPTSHHFLNANAEQTQASYPQRFKTAASALREVFDFDIVDEPMIADGALDGYRVLVFLEGNTVEASTLQTVASWIEKSGTAVAYDMGAVETVEGDPQPWNEMFGIAGEFRSTSESFPIEEKYRAFLRNMNDGDGLTTDQACSRISTRGRLLAGNEDTALLWANPAGDGWAVMFAGSWGQRRTYYELLRDIVYHLSALDPGKRDAPAVACQWDGVYGTVFEGGKVLLYNPTDEKKHIDVFGATVELQPVSLRHVFVETSNLS
ncbi:MAG: family 14 glycosylhydrolase [Lentisphaeria bacterium]|nr:family 14 glycosylhydrolase [Lentisphaeria bacterium]MDP7741702.1 family 14 glycosylhydrolase [Lentisphaeria bacterium]